MKTAMSSRDPRAILSLLTADFIGVDVSGQTVNGDQMAREVSALPIDPHKDSSTTIKSVARKGSSATVNQKYDMRTTKTGADGAVRNVELIAESTDSWILKDGTWLLQRSITNQMDYFVNGVAVMHKTRRHRQTPTNWQRKDSDDG
jgi:hypothetical protein